jgi:hypothetical protein
MLFCLTERINFFSIFGFVSLIQDFTAYLFSRLNIYILSYLFKKIECMHEITTSLVIRHNSYSGGKWSH